MKGLPMLIFLVVTHEKHGCRAECAFTSLHEASMYAEQQEAVSSIFEVPVLGESHRRDLVYTLLWDDATPDTSNVEIMYGSYRQACRAVGDLGQVRELPVEPSAAAALWRQRQGTAQTRQPDDDAQLHAMSLRRRDRARKPRAAPSRLR